MIDGKQLARRIFLRTLDELDVASSISRCVSFAHGSLVCGELEFQLTKSSDLRVVAVGKAAHGMLDGMLSVLPPEVTPSGIVSAASAPAKPHPHFKYFLGGHPTPKKQSLASGKAALELLRGCSVETLVIVLLSGGGSALFELSLIDSISLEELQQLNRVLVTCGASISEINTIRKHISAVKGGRLAKAAYPATILTLAISDVPVGKETALASGPTVPDPTTREQVAGVIEKYALRDRLPKKVIDWMDRGAMPETPKAGDVCFERANFQLVLGMHELFHAAHRIAESEDCLAFCDNSTDDWPLEKAADFLLAQLDELQAANPRQPVALIADGELSSAVTGDGLGGRNSAFVLACVEKIAGKGITVLSAGSDGIDGNSPAAGAVANGETLARAQAAGIDVRDYFRRSDSFRFFQTLDDAIVTGPTGNNLRDMRLLIAFPREAYSRDS